MHYTAKARKLGKAGHDVRIVTHQVFEPLVKEYGLDFCPLRLDPHQVLLNQALAELGNNFIRITRWLRQNFQSTLQNIFEATLNASRDAELMLNSALSLAGWHVAERLGIPALAALLWPVTPSRHLPHAVMGKNLPTWLPFRGTANYFSAKMSNQLFFNLMLPLINKCRKEILDLQPMSARDYWTVDSVRHPTPFIYGYSRCVVPKPSDWGNNQQITGYWFLDAMEDYQPEAALLDYLADGPPPVYVGFGSTVDSRPEEMTRVVIDALREINQRGILLGGWSALGSRELPDSILRVDGVPHDWLFPRMAAVVHHGGAGTTAAGLRAGVPNVIVPSFGDQFFWGGRVQEIGAGPKPIPRAKLTATRLATAIQQAITDNSIGSKADMIGRQIRAENGVEVAIRMIEAIARDGHL
jgi:sterol 3beta-glucosyltransferase